MRGSLILYLKGMRILLFRISGFYYGILVSGKALKYIEGPGQNFAKRLGPWAATLRQGSGEVFRCAAF